MRRLLGSLMVTLVVLAVPQAGFAWKPYSHNKSALEAYWDAVDDGYVTIDGRTYRVDPKVVEALRTWPAFYNAGVIGPDGFPDLTFGQSVIHPTDTGEWLRHVLSSAQAAQNEDRYSPQQRQQILAFAYGFLTHAAGDMWGHSFVNDFARGVFPSVSEIATSPDMAAIAARHIIAEGYVGDATPGFDAHRTKGLEGRGPVPFPLLPLPIVTDDRSDDSSPGFAYDAPHRFIYETLVRPDAATPSAERGPIIDFFLDLDAGLGRFQSGESLSSALQRLRALNAAIAEVHRACDFDEADDVVACPVALGKFGLTSLEDFFKQVGDLVVKVASEVLNAYLVAWRQDIRSGLQEWGRFGLATTKGLFDAQTRRELQNRTCSAKGADATSLTRAECEAQVGVLDTVLDSVDPFINQHLLSMVGLPDAAGEIRQMLGVISDILDGIMQALLGPFNPLDEAKATVEAYVKDLIQDAIADVLGVDVRTLEDFLTQPHRFTCLEREQIRIGGKTQTIELFRPGDHGRLDGYLGFPPGDGHHVVEPGSPLDASCGRLEDSAEFGYGAFSAMRNTVTTAKLLLLDGPELNRALGDSLGREISFYASGQNLMVESFGNVNVGKPWLRSIDSDHAWRQDGLPRFCDQGGLCPGDAEPRLAELNGGEGSFPPFESCVLREGFRRLYQDWESGSGPFPDLGDAASADAANDPEPPRSALARGGALFYSNGTDSFVGEDHRFVQSAADGPAPRAFAASELALRRRVVLEGEPEGPFAGAAQNEAFALGPQDGRYRIDLQSADPCHGFDGAPSAAEPVQSSTFVLDTRAPALSCGAPFGREYDTDDLFTVAYGVDDGALGSGVAASSANVDGFQALPGIVPTTAGATLDLSQFYPGSRTVGVSARDQLSHSSSLACTFALHATATSLQTNVASARDQGLLRAGIATSLLAKLQQAEKHHDAGRHPVEHNVLRAFVNELEAQSGKGIDASVAARLAAFARDIVALGR